MEVGLGIWRPSFRAVMCATVLAVFRCASRRRPCPGHNALQPLTCHSRSLITRPPVQGGAQATRQFENSAASGCRHAVPLPSGSRRSLAAIAAMQLAPAYSAWRVAPDSFPLCAHWAQSTHEELVGPLRGPVAASFACITTDQPCTVGRQRFSRFLHPIRPASAVGVRRIKAGRWRKRVSLKTSSAATLRSAAEP